MILWYGHPMTTTPKPDRGELEALAERAVINQIVGRQCEQDRDTDAPQCQNTALPNCPYCTIHLLKTYKDPS